MIVMRNKEQLINSLCENENAVAISINAFVLKTSFLI